MALTYNNQFEIELGKLVEAERQHVLDLLATGGGIEDFAAYRERVGYLRALGKVVELFEDVQKVLNQR